MPMIMSRYPKDWNERRAIVRKRSGNRCELCKARNGKPHPITGSKVVLTCAHMDDEMEYGEYIWNDPKDLLDLCQRCHNKIDGPKRRHRRKRRNNG